MSTVIVNTLTGTTTAGSISVTGEGNSTTTNLQQGLAKLWSVWDSSNGSSKDSFNSASLTDNATGRWTNNFTNNMGNANWSGLISANNGTTDVSGAHDYGFAIVDRATATYSIDIENAINTQND